MPLRAIACHKHSPAIRTVQVDLTQPEKLGLVKREGKARAVEADVILF